MYKKIPIDLSVYLRYLHQDGGIKCSELCRRYPNYPQRTIYHHAKKPIGESLMDNRKFNSGRPRKLTERDKRSILKTIPKLRTEVGSFTSKRVKLEAGIGEDISNRTVRRCLNESGYKYRQSRKKGLLSKKDMIIRNKFAKKAKKILKDDFWTKGISFYLDGVGFTHKFNPKDQACSTSSMAWRKSSEGLALSTKGKKEGTGGRVANFLVAIAHEKGVLCCEQYMGNITGESFADFVRENFPEMFENSSNPRGKLFLQDGDPRQNSKKARDAMDSVNCRLFSIPARSPDINPIENFFHLIRNKLEQDAIASNIQRESFEEFSLRIKSTICNYPRDVIDRTIESIPKRMGLIIKGKGLRTKY